MSDSQNVCFLFLTKCFKDKYYSQGISLLNRNSYLVSSSTVLFLFRYQAQDYSGTMLAEVTAMKTARPAFAPIFPNQYNHGTTWPKPVKVINQSSYFHKFQ